MAEREPNSQKQFLRGGAGKPSDAVLRTVASKMGVDKAALPPLYDSVDPDALNRLFDGREGGTVTFDYCGYQVTVQRNGDVTIRK